MRICESKNCNRALKANEKKFCPACQSKRSNKRKKRFGKIGSALAVVASVTILIVTKGKSKGWL